jgi:hypothetical protein
MTHFAHPFHFPARHAIRTGKNLVAYRAGAFAAMRAGLMPGELQSHLGNPDSSAIRAAQPQEAF